jgi:hypothetical protein
MGSKFLYTTLFVLFPVITCFAQGDRSHELGQLYKWRDARLQEIHEKMNLGRAKLEREREKLFHQLEEKHHSQIGVLEQESVKAYSALERKWEISMEKLEDKRRKMERLFHKKRESLEQTLHKKMHHLEKETERFRMEMEEKFEHRFAEVHHAFEKETKRVMAEFQERLNHWERGMPLHHERPVMEQARSFQRTGENLGRRAPHDPRTGPSLKKEPSHRKKIDPESRRRKEKTATHRGPSHTDRVRELRKKLKELEGKRDRLLRSIEELKKEMR